MVPIRTKLMTSIALVGSRGSLLSDRIAPQASKQLSVSLSNVQFKGIESFQPREVSMTGKHLRVVGLMKVLNFSGDYDMNGRIPILPIQGAGKFLIQQIGQEMDGQVTVRNEERDGKKYYYMAENTGKLKFQSVKKVIWIP